MNIPFNENEFAPNLAEGYDDNYVAAMAELQENFLSTGGDAAWRKRKLYHIVDKNEGKTILFNDNRVQDDLNNHAHEWLIILKARQFGVSTKYLIENFDEVLWNPNTWCAIIAHDQRTLETLFSKIRFAWDRLDPSIKDKLPQPRSESKYELYWPELNSRIYVALKCLGGTNQIVHFSEDARIPDSRYAETLETVPKTGRVVRESTPTEINTRFHRDYLDGKKQKNGFVSKFYPWWWGNDYQLPVTTVKESNLSAPELALIENYELTYEQIEWRRWKWKNLEQSDGSNLFPREYPEDDITCLCATTRVGTSKGIVQIKDVEVGSKCDHGIIVNKMYRGKKAVYDVITKNGYCLRATGDHLLAKEDDNFIQVAESNGNRIKLQKPVTADIQHIAKWKGFGGVNHGLRIAQEWGSFIGFFMGDGSFGGDTLDFAFDARDKDLVVYIKDLVLDLFNTDLRLRSSGTKNGGINGRSTNKRYSDIFLNLGMIQRNGEWRGLNDYKRKVCVPECIWRSPKSVIKQFLRFLFEADGWTNPEHRYVKFFSKYLDFMRDVQKLLLVFDIGSRIRPVIRKLNGKEYPGHELVMNVRDSILYMKEIGFFTERKSNGWDLEKKIGKNAKEFHVIDEVVEITPAGVEDVWDLEIDGDPVFGADGLLVHNCFLSSGDAAFDQDYLQWYHGWLQNNAKAKAYVKGYVGEAANGRIIFREGENGPLKIHEPPKAGVEYCAGVDVSMGYETSDWQTIQILRRDNDYQCAEYRIKTDISLFSKDVEFLCKFYNEAFVNPERNSMGEVVIRHLLLNYENSHIYAEDDPIKVRKSRITKYGYWSGVRYKQALVALIQAYLNGDEGFIFSVELIEEMMSYQKHNLRTVSHGTRDVGFSGKKHDDLIMGFGLALEHNRVLPTFHRPKTDYVSIYHAIAKARRKNQRSKRPKNAMCY